MSDHPYPLLPLNDAETAATIAAMNDGISAVGAHLVIQVLRQNGWQSAADAAAKDAELERLTAQLNAQADAMRELDDKATEAYEARDTALHDLDEALDRQLKYANRAIANGERADRAETTIERVRALCTELMTVDPADLTRAQRRQLPASVCRAVLAALDQPDDQTKETS